MKLINTYKGVNVTEQIKYLEKSISSSGMASKMYLEEIMMQVLEGG